MTPTIGTTVRYSSGSSVTDFRCVKLTIEKERYTPYFTLKGEWYPGTRSTPPISEITSVMIFLNGQISFYGYPTGTKTVMKNGRAHLSVSAVGYTSFLLKTNMQDGMLYDVNLTTLANTGPAFTGVGYEEKTPTVNYVNYYSGTSQWNAIVAYSLRATGIYPYIHSFNTVRVSPHDPRKTLELDGSVIISQSFETDYSKVLSGSFMRDVDGTEYAASAMNTKFANPRSITRLEIRPFDNEWIMDPQAGAEHRINYSMRKANAKSYSFLGYEQLEILDSFKTSAGDSGEIDRVKYEIIPGKGAVTTIWSYQDGYCPYSLKSAE